MNDNILSKSTDLLDILKMDAELIAPGATIAEGVDAIVNTNEDSVSEVDMDEYMKRFEKIQQRNENAKQIIAKLLTFKANSGPSVGAVIDFIVEIHAQNEDMCALLIEMNNLFGK